MTEQVEYRRTPPGFSTLQAVSMSPFCVWASFSMSSGVLMNLMSGWRRITPVPEQGASRSTRSNSFPSHHLPVFLASAARQVTERESLLRFSSRRFTLDFEMSSAVTEAVFPVSSRISEVLPPGAAHMSRMRSPFSGARYQTDF